MPSRERQPSGVHSQSPLQAVSPTHEPLAHRSAWVQGRPSSHGIPWVTRVHARVSTSFRVPQVPSEHTGSPQVRVCWPLVEQPIPTQRPQVGGHERRPHGCPSVSRVHARVSSNAVPSAQAPSAHTRGRHERLWVPDSAHEEGYEHALHDVSHTVSPQPLPSVSREHARDSEYERAVQVPERHSPLLQLRAWAPLSPQSPEKPPHASHEPQVVAAHEPPSVVRVHACVSSVSEGTHAPETHAKLRTTRP